MKHYKPFKTQSRLL